MKYIVLLVISLCGITSYAQSEEEAVKNAIETFFEGFHEQDSVKMKSRVSNDLTMQTIGISPTGDTLLRKVEFSRFLQSIVSIPDTIPFREEITRYAIQLDGPMAHVWTEYKFWLRNGLSHCGVNSFQLLKQEGQWRIIYLVDTRRKQDCDQ